jgi:aromatic ring-opening dioxygenase catalytic subunit (LigB family)
MAAITLGLCASHTPLLTLTPEQWQHRAAADLANRELNLSDGRFLSYEQLLAEVGPRYAEAATHEVLARKEAACQAALDRLADALEQAAPDVVLIVGDDQRELFSAANQPAVAIYHGAEVAMMAKYAGEEKPQWVRDMGRGYWMDAAHRIPGAPELALSLIRGLMDRDIDVASVARIDDPATAAFGHAYGFIVKRLFRGRAIPVVPVLLNTYYPPNVPSARRCHDIGLAIAQVLKSLPHSLRVAVIGSGGLSHFVVDEALDRRVMAAIASGDHSALREIPREALNSGSSEILNWVLTAGAAAELAPRWQDYQPIQRTPAGTGVGAAFAIWG